MPLLKGIDMNISDMENKFQSDKLFQTQFAGALAKKIQATGIPDEHSKFFITQEDGSNLISELSVGKDSDNLKYQVLIADAAVQTLKENGVTDFTGIEGMKNGNNPAALNVVYKNGGWIVNSKVGQMKIDGDNGALLGGMEGSVTSNGGGFGGR